MNSDNTEVKTMKRSLGLIGAWALSLGCAVGWGAFMMPGNTFLPVAGPLGTVIGIIIGAAFGSFMGGITVGALEPNFGFFVKDVSAFAILAGVAGTAVFATLTLLWALRSFPRFDLTDINRF